MQLTHLVLRHPSGCFAVPRQGRCWDSRYLHLGSRSLTPKYGVCKDLTCLSVAMSCSSMIIDSNASWRRDLNWGSVLAPLSIQTTSWPRTGASCLKRSRLLNTSTLPSLNVAYVSLTPHWHFLGEVRVIRRFGLPKWSTKVLRTCCWCKTSSRVISTVLGPGALGGILRTAEDLDVLKDVDVDMKANIYIVTSPKNPAFPPIMASSYSSCGIATSDSPFSCANGSSELVVLNNLFLHMDLAPYLLVTKTEQQQLVLERWNRPRCNWFPLRNHCLGHFGWNVDVDQGHDNWEGANLVVFICLSTLTCETAFFCARIKLQFLRSCKCKMVRRKHWFLRECNSLWIFPIRIWSKGHFLLKVARLLGILWEQVWSRLWPI